MNETFVQIVVSALYLLALINPISKVSVLCVLSDADRKAEYRSVIVKSSFIAAGILFGSMVCGDFLLRTVFHVRLYALMLSGGAVLCWVGFHALRKGVFFERGTQDRFEDMALVPLACPMIAGPATIAACIALRAKDGLWIPVIALCLAILINHLIMRLSSPISELLTRFNILGALIRITGLIVMTIGSQMMLDGFGDWFGTLSQ